MSAKHKILSMPGDTSQESPILTYLNTPTKFKTTRLTQNILGQFISIDLKYPEPQGINPNTWQVEQDMIAFADTFGLYAKRRDLLRKSKFSYLPGRVSPHMTKAQLKAISFYLCPLFNNDDTLDLTDEKITLNVVKKHNERIVSVLDGGDIQDDDPPRIKAMAHVYQTFIKPLIEKGLDYTFIKKSLHRYLDSTELELTNGKQNIKAYSVNRKHTSGGKNVIMLMGFFMGLELKFYLDKHISLNQMLTQILYAIGILNDLYSLKKEFKELQKKIEGNGFNQNDPIVIKQHVTFNGVLLKWANNKTLPEAIASVNKLYGNYLDAAYIHKKALVKSFNADPKLAQIVYLFEGWLFGHPAWALKNSERYS